MALYFCTHEDAQACLAAFPEFVVSPEFVSPEFVVQ